MVGTWWIPIIASFLGVILKSSIHQTSIFSIWIRKRNGTPKNIFCIEDNENSRTYLKRIKQKIETHSWIFFDNNN